MFYGGENSDQLMRINTIERHTLVAVAEFPTCNVYDVCTVD